MSRVIAATVRQEIESPNTGVMPLFFMTFDHPDLDDPVRIVNDVIDYTYQGVSWVGFPFEATLLSDGENPPRATVSVQNVDRRIGEILLAVPSPLEVTLEILTSLDFTNGVEIGSPTAMITASNLLLKNIRGDAMTIQGDLSVWDPTSEPYPAIRATKDRFPGLYK